MKAPDSLPADLRLIADTFVPMLLIGPKTTSILYDHRPECSFSYGGECHACGKPADNYDAMDHEVAIAARAIMASPTPPALAPQGASQSPIGLSAEGRSDAKRAARPDQKPTARRLEGKP